MKSKLSISTLRMLAVAFLATFALSTTAQADVIYTGTTTNTSAVSNGFNGGSSALSAGLAVTTNGVNNIAGGLASTDNISTLLGAFTPGRTIQATDVVTLNFDVAGFTNGDPFGVENGLRANGIEVGLAPGTTFRPNNHLLYNIDDAGAASGPVALGGSNPFGGTLGLNSQTGIVESSLADGYSVELVIDQNGFTYTFSDIIVNNAGAATTQTISQSFTGTQFIDNIGSQHLYITHQYDTTPAAGAVATFNNVSIQVVSAVPEPSSLAVLGLGALGLIARRRRR